MSELYATNIAMVPLLPIDYQTLMSSQPGATFARLVGGEILLLRGVPQVERIQRHVRRAAVANGHSGNAVDDFFSDAGGAAPDTLAAVCHAFRQVRDSRLVSRMFAPLLRAIGGPPEILADTGHFRCIFPQGFGALASRADMAGILLPGRGKEPEPMLNGRTTGGMPHRDLRQTHYTFQYNLWFPLHDIPREASLLLFPQAYRRAVPFYEAVDTAAPPDDWGYGPALRQAMRAGDVLLFHSQHFHASPSEAPDLSRVTVELRVATGCRDDNGAVYRHLFWNLKNFAEESDEQGEIALLQARDGTDPQHFFSALFDDAEAARMAANLRAGPQFIRHLKPMNDEQWLGTLDALLAAPYADDRLVALTRILLLAGHPSLAERVAGTVLTESDSYMFLMELGLLLGRFGHDDRAALAYRAAKRCADASDILFPREASALCDQVLAASWPGETVNRYDWRLYVPAQEILRYTGDDGTLLRLTLALGHVLAARRMGEDDVIWHCDVEEWMTEDRLPAEAKSEEDVARELCKQRYLELPQLVHALLARNEQLRQENETLKKALREG
jgi:hypothetical protein